MSTPRWVYFFGQGHADAGSELKQLVGGKGASLGDMTRASLNVPPGFTIATECCELFYKNDRHWPDGLEQQIRDQLHRLEKLSGRTFGRGNNPLLVAVRSGAAQSMPGMMDTVLNVGLNPDCVRAMGERTDNAQGSWLAYLHFQLMYAKTVAGLDPSDLDRVVHGEVIAVGKHREADLDAAQLEHLCGRIAGHFQTSTRQPFPTDPWASMCGAIDAVFSSWMSSRAITYRKHHKIDGLKGTAVNVQMMCPSEVSGVLFTGNPVDPSSEQLLIEASYGLGEAVVLGKVTPDRFVVNKKSLSIDERHIAHKEMQVATLAADGRGQTGAMDEASLTDFQIEELTRLGLRVEQYFKHPCDLEWALSQGQFFLLQARPIRYKGAATISGEEKEQVRLEEIDRLKSLAEPVGTVWSRFNLSEILADPTPMTWSIIRPFMSGRGGFGLMYRDLGFSPDHSLDEECVYDLVAGRVYCNLSREPRMQFAKMPFVHDFAKLKADPSRAIYPQAEFTPRRATFDFWFHLPLLALQQWWSESKRQGMLRGFPARFEQKVVPPFLEEVAVAWKEPWENLAGPQLIEKLDHWRRRTLNEFARDSLKPTALAAILMAKIEASFARRFQPPGKKLEPNETPGNERAKLALRDLTMGVRPPAGADLATAIERLSAGNLPRDEFLNRFGHRGSHEMELAQPRWREDHSTLDSLTSHTTHTSSNRQSFPEVWARIAKELRLAPFQLPFVERELKNLHQYLGLREAGKHYMLLGYDLIRRALVMLDRQYKLDGAIFFLTRDELPDLVASKRVSGNHHDRETLLSLANKRRRRREVCLSLNVPQVLFSDDLEAMGRAIAVDGASSFKGTPLSAGHAEAIAWVLDEVSGASPPTEPYILVCPTTDPAWVPLFAKAKGLVMETGGVLSHGAIVAREFGLPAVAGIPDIQRRLHTGQKVFVDGGSGVVKILD